MPLPTSFKIVLVSSGQPSLNPRLVKEADCLVANGYKVTVLYAYWNDWGTHLDENFLPSKAWKALRIGGDPKNKPLIYLMSRLIYKFSVVAVKKLGIQYFNKFAISRSSFFLIREAKKHNADIYIGHNLGALPAVVIAAGKHKTLCGFDAEDFHRYETSNNQRSFDVRLKTAIEEQYIPKLNYLTSSSSQIADAYVKLFPDKEPETILNVFPSNLNIKEPKLNTSAVVKLFWVSQTIGSNRGLEDVIKALKFLKDANFELHLLGNCSDKAKAFIEHINKGVAKIFFHQPVAPNALGEFASAFDIGLALEPGFSLNNDNALSNKIFTYLEAGLAIIASDTTAQKNFINRHPDIGKVYEKGNIKMLVKILSDYFKNRQQLYKSCYASWNLSQQSMNWDNECKKFLAIVAKTLKN